MERKLILIPILIFLQTSFFPIFFPSFPNLLLILVAIFSFFSSSIYFPLFAGFFLDLFSERPFGFYSFFSLLIFFFISKLKKYV